MHQITCLNCQKIVYKKKKAAKFCCQSCASQYNSKTKNKTMLEKYGCISPFSLPEVQEKIKQTNLDRYGVENPSQNNTIREKIKQTNLDRYGVDNPFKSDVVKERIRQTSLDRYGVENPFSLPEVQEKIRQIHLDRYGVENPSQNNAVREKATTTYKEKYGVNSPFSLPKTREKIRITMIDKYGDFKYTEFNKQEIQELNRTKLISEIAEIYGCSPSYMAQWMNKNGLTPKRHKTSILQKYIIETISTIIPSEKLILNDRTVIKPMELDIFIPSHNLAIEVNGLYWHSEIRGGKDKNYHLNKTKLCREKGITLLHFTDDEINNKSDIIFSMIRAKLGASIFSIGARKCQVIENYDRSVVSEFIEDNHIQGNIPFGRSYCLVYNNEIVAAMTIGKPRFTKQYDWELLRFAVKKDHAIPGGFSKLLSKVSGSIVSYASLNYSTGNVYQRNGFVLSHISTPNYWYIDPTFCGRESRIKYQKHKLSSLLENFDPELSEWENMKNHGFDRIWDCGNQVWVKNSSKIS